MALKGYIFTLMACTLIISNQVKPAALKEWYNSYYQKKATPKPLTTKAYIKNMIDNVESMEKILTQQNPLSAEEKSAFKAEFSNISTKTISLLEKINDNDELKKTHITSIKTGLASMQKSTETLALPDQSSLENLKNALLFIEKNTHAPISESSIAIKPADEYFE